MKSSAWVSGLCFALLAVGCGGGNPCERFKQAGTAISTKGQPCGVSSTGPVFDEAACQAAVPQCSSADQQRILDYADCIDRLSTCSTSPAQVAIDWAFSLATCRVQLAALSSACIAVPH